MSKPKLKPLTDTEIERVYQLCSAEFSKNVKHLFDDSKMGGEFYAHVLMQMCRQFTHTEVPTAAVSVTNKLNLYINPFFWMFGLKDSKQRQAVLLHELLHIIFHHCTRGRDFGNARLANIAADLVVNSLIPPSVFGDKSKDFIFPQNFKLPLDQTFDYYYKNFPIEKHKICTDPSHDSHGHTPGGSPQGSGSGSSGSESGDSEGSGGQNGSQDDMHGEGSGQCPVCGGLRTFDYHGKWNESDDEHISEAMKESLVKDAVNRAADAVKNAGNLPASIQQLIKMAKEKPQIPWERVLRRFVSKVSTGVLGYTKKRISKRFGTRPGIIIRPKLKIMLLIDSSGSVSDPEYAAFINEGFGTVKTGAEVEYIEWDTEINGPFPLKKTSKVVRGRSGGTDPSKAIDYVNKNKQKYDAVIILTDGFLYAKPTHKPKVPCLWVLTHNGSDEYVKDQYQYLRMPNIAE